MATAAVKNLNRFKFLKAPISAVTAAVTEYFSPLNLFPPSNLRSRGESYVQSPTVIFFPPQSRKRSGDITVYYSILQGILQSATVRFFPPSQAPLFHRAISPPRRKHCSWGNNLIMNKNFPPLH